MFDAYASSRECLLAILLLTGLGLLTGFAISADFFGRGTRFGNTVQYARYYSEQPERHQLSPGLSRGIFFALLFAFYPLLKGWCPGFLGHHLLFAAVLFGGAVSSAAWLLMNYIFQSGVETERSARIEQFIADPEAEVPAPVPAPPPWLRTWNWLNFGILVLLVAEVLREMLALPPAG